MLALKVTGMSCDGCVKSIDRVVRKVPGVKDVKVTLEGGEVDIEGDPDRALVVQAIRKAGYDIA